MVDDKLRSLAQTEISPVQPLLQYVTYFVENYRQLQRLQTLVPY